MSFFARETETDAVSTSRQLVASEVPNKIHRILSKEVITLFRDSHELPDESLIQERLIRPLEALWGANEVYSVLQSNPTVANFCGKVFKNGEPAIFCKDCQTDPTCCLCLECFDQSEHKNHNYKMFASGGGGCCDCGDPEAWNDHTYCNIHKPQEVESHQVDPISHLQEPLVQCARSFLSTMMWYCMTVLNWDESRSVPPIVSSPETQSLLQEDTFLAFLINDEVHSYDDVITGLSRHLGMTPTAAMDLATCVDRRGRGILCKGSEQACLTAQSNVNKSLRNSPLGVKLYHSALVRHQNCAIYLLNFLKELAEKSEGFCRLLAMELVKPCLSSSNQCLLDRYFITDNSLWIEARLNWSRMIMNSIYKDFEYKKQLAVSLARNYRKLATNFMADSHDHDVCAMNLTVQLFTVPSLSRMLIVEHNLMETVVSTIGDIISPLYDTNKECLNLHTKEYKHDRIVFLLYDLRYLLRNRPEVWTDAIRTRTREGGTVFLNLLSSMENMDCVKRQTGLHVDREPKWENSFNFSIILMQSIKLFVEWCTSDRKVLLEITNLALRRLTSMSTYSYKSHYVAHNIMGTSSCMLISFDIFKDKVSVHHPLARLIAGLLAGGASKYNMSIRDVLRIDEEDSRVPLLLLEPCARSVVLSSQVLSAMWKRNGYGLLNQALHYQLHLSRSVMYDKDVIMLQSMASIMDPNVFLYALLYKFRLENWFTSPSTAHREWKQHGGDDATRFVITEIEELMFLLIVLYGERYQVGVGEGMSQEDSIRRELIHLLYLGPLPHSQILKKFKMTEDDTIINKLINEVSVLKRVSGKSLFELKEEHLESYDPFYYHYSKVEQSKGEEEWRKIQKKSGKNSKPDPAPPCLPPSLTAPYQGILQFASSPVLLKILFNVFSEADKDNPLVWSVRLLHQALHLSALILAEEYRMEENTFARKCLSFDGGGIPSLLPHLERLRSSPKVEERHHLLVWVIQQLQKVQREASGDHSSLPSVMPTFSDNEDTDSATPSRKSLIAEEQRKKMMNQIAAMQKKFFEEHKDELELMEPTNTPDTRELSASETGSALLCAVGMTTMMSHDQTPASCLLCQEAASNSGDQSFVLSVLVQRSSVMRREEHNISKDIDFLSGRLDNKWGIFTGGCGHIMHAECWKKYVDDKQAEHRRRFFFPLHGHTVQWGDGEYLCPLCQTFGNTVLPLATHPPRGPSYMPSRPLTLTGTRSLIGCMVKLGDIVAEDSSGVTDPVFEELTGIINKLFSISQSSFQPIASVSVEEGPMEYVFTQHTFMQGYAEPPDSNNPKSPIALWNNCVYTITGLEHSMREEGKFLLDSLSSRQMNIVYSLVELVGVACNKVDTKTLSEYANGLLINLMPSCSAFSDHPSVVDMDIFNILGNLRIIFSALIKRLTASQSSDGNLFYPALIGLVDTCMVSMATAAAIMQYLLCAQPGMDTDDTRSQDDSMDTNDSDSSQEMFEGLKLQKLWVKLRGYAVKQSESDTPPSPLSLLVGVQEHLYPFLQCVALFYHSITGIKFVHSSASEASNLSDLCTFLGLPHSLPSLFEDPCIQKVAQNLCTHPGVTGIVKGLSISRDLAIFRPTRRLISLPQSYSNLVSKASQFKCPGLTDLGGDESRAAMLCLLCGEMICCNSYCCRKEVENNTKIGGLTHHSLRCGSGYGVALWILESYVVLLNATDVHRVRGCTLTPPYIDEYGEPDPGLRRGSPLHFNSDSYKIIQGYWLNHQLPERISKEMEQNVRLVQINWALM